MNGGAFSFVRGPLARRLRHLETRGLAAYLRRLSNEELYPLLRPMAAHSPTLARRLREDGGGWIREGRDGPDEADDAGAAAP